MGRSVNYHSNAHAKIYLHYENEDDGHDDCWDLYKDYIIETIQAIAPSIEISSKDWHDREVLKIAENNLCSVWISEYCGLVSLSFVPDQDHLQRLAEHWIDQVVGKIKQKFVTNNSTVLNKLGSFSNGEGVFELAK